VVEGSLQGLNVGDAVRVVQIDAVLGEDRRDLAHEVVRHAGRVNDLGALQDGSGEKRRTSVMR
jgi:hypothetical protein